jgi:hypothetical protein
MSANIDFASWEGRSLTQASVNPGPVPSWNMLQAQVKFGDVDPRYSDQRFLVNASPTPGIARVDEGDETWLRFIQMWPQNWIGKFPKWDQLADWPTIFHGGGSSSEWHHGPINNDWSNFGGSAPIYFSATDQNVVCYINKYVEGQWGVPDRTIVLAPLVRGHWYDHVVRTKWSVDPTIGLMEFYMDGKQVADYYGPTLFPNCYNWFLTGIYRNLNIGGQVDQNGSPLVWPVDAQSGVNYGLFIPHKNQFVYPLGDGVPQQIFQTGFVLGDKQADVEDAFPSDFDHGVPVGSNPLPPTTPAGEIPPPDGWVPPPPEIQTPNLPANAVEGLNQLIEQNHYLGILIPQLNVAIQKLQDATAVAEQALKECQWLLNDTTVILNKGPW